MQHWAEMGSKSPKHVESVLSIFEFDLLCHFGWYNSSHAAWNNIVKATGSYFYVVF